MNSTKKWGGLGLSFMIFYFVVLTKNAYAYLDPGSGSYLLQLLLAGLLAASFAIKTFWKRVWFFVSDRFLKKKQEPEENAKD